MLPRWTYKWANHIPFKRKHDKEIVEKLPAVMEMAEDYFLMSPPHHKQNTWLPDKGFFHH